MNNFGKILLGLSAAAGVGALYIANTATMNFESVDWLTKQIEYSFRLGLSLHKKMVFNLDSDRIQTTEFGGYTVVVTGAPEIGEVSMMLMDRENLIKMIRFDFNNNEVINELE